MLCKCHWIVLSTVHFTAFCLGGPFFRTLCISQTMHYVKRLQKLAKLSIQTKVDFFVARSHAQHDIGRQHERRHYLMTTNEHHVTRPRLYTVVND